MVYGMTDAQTGGLQAKKRALRVSICGVRQYRQKMRSAVGSSSATLERAQKTWCGVTTLIALAKALDCRFEGPSPHLG